MGKLVKIGKEEVEIRYKRNLTKKDYEFLTQYAITHNKVGSMRAVGLHLKRDGTEHHRDTLTELANYILRNPMSREFVMDMQKEIMEANCHSLAKAVDETYSLYLKLIELRSFHEANIAYERFCKLIGILDSKSGNNVSVNTQIVTDSKEVNINYIQPKELDVKENGKPIGFKQQDK